MRIYFNSVIKIEMAGLKCDAEGCDYRDDTIHIKDYEIYVNAPCPKCGANLLTEKDMHTIKFLLVCEKLFGWIRFPSFNPPKRHRFAMDGRGKIKRKERVKDL